MKPLWIGIAFASVLSLVALFSIIKFATDLDDSKMQDSRVVCHTESPLQNLILRISKTENTVAMMDKHSMNATERYPYIVAILSQKANETFSFSCFGCIILMNWIVTAAHCKKPGHSHRILLYYDYAHNHTKTYPLVLWTVHEGYKPDSTTPLHDIAVAKVNQKVEPTTYTAAFRTNTEQQIHAGVWKTLLTMDRKTFLTNHMDIYDVKVTEPPRCYEYYGVLLDENLICVDMSQHPDCFVSEFGPLFTSTDRAVGVLAMQPKECDNKVAIFTNVSSYYHWILKVTAVGREKLVL